jgi:myosin I
VAPHVFAIAESAFYNMKSYKDNQCIIIRFYSLIKPFDLPVENLEQEKPRLRSESCNTLQMSPVGPLRKFKKSRIWYLLQILFSKVLGAQKHLETITLHVTENISRFSSMLRGNQLEQISQTISWKRTALLDKSKMNATSTFSINLPKLLLRIIEVYPDSRFLLIADRFGVQPPESYLYTSRSRCYNADGIDDHVDFINTLKAMATIGLSQQEIDDIFKILAAILWLGNVQFVENNEGNAAIGDDNVPAYIAYLMDVDAQSVNKVHISVILV